MVDADLDDEEGALRGLVRYEHRDGVPVRGGGCDSKFVNGTGNANAVALTKPDRGRPPFHTV
jgi:hypothetical protein